MLLVVQIVALLCAVTAIYAIYYDIRAFYVNAGKTWTDYIEWGLILTLVAAIALAVLCFLQYCARTSSTTH